MNEDVPLAALLMPVLIKPILEKLERKENAAAQILQTSLTRTEKNSPGFLLELVRALLRETQSDKDVNITEQLLRLQGTLADSEPELRVNRPEEIFQELNRKAVYLKKVLSRVPDQIGDRKSFLDTIKEIASAIKKLLDAVNGVTAHAPYKKHALEQRRREFVKYSKRFSNTLKEYFKEGEVEPVYVSGLYLIYQTNQIVMTTKRDFERTNVSNGGGPSLRV
ncbi:programmed cell death protein 10-like [Varroa jacobsoni]|uniref:Programmed cell death protein 10 dimerisation domain-containing protein n=1 Tax=Varroa destructor TaxID=109461 RepID=A0A7M7MJH2_VARDE|nr:programmed cell death protein 10-like [Varroa destructor]XP_022702598.1 programmed cell death protein 10-like [Varroa jacobsoni]